MASTKPSTPRSGLKTNPTLLKNNSRNEVDPRDHQNKSHEKDQIVGLNDKFVDFIEKVRRLEEQNKVLETRLKILLEQESYKGNIKEIVDELSNNLQRQIDGLALDRQKLLSELGRTQNEVDHNKKRYQDEMHGKTEAENDFVITKKDVDDVYLQKVDLELELEDLMSELDFLKRGYDEEIKELQSQVQNDTVILEVDNVRALDMNEIIDEVKAQYEAMAARGREEAELWQKKRINDISQEAGKHEQDLRDVRKEIAELQRLIQRLNAEIDALKRQKENLEKAITDTERQGEQAREDALVQIRLLEKALKKAKHDMALQVREYHELMNLKLALDIEIATYKKLLEGEEMRLANQNKAPARRNPNNKLDDRPPSQRRQEPHKATQPPPNKTPKKTILIKTIETKDGKIVSESNHISEE
ncbi:keratin, type II cytoskeletal 8-like isoform X1 [Anguilla rostrata]|uniref:keratin, type II cytoskeletal 8-like isoform X1 n=1 Tax=Anguilla rostrata TaxID=7938 RepID=UPI0030D28653